MIGKVIGKCQIESLVGAGAMGVVYRAQHLTLGVPVALKMIRPELVHTGELLDRFVREAQLMAQLRHPNVVRVFDVGQEGEVPFIVMEFLAGTTLLNFVAEKAPLDLKTFYSIFQPLSVGLDAAHEGGIVHRDMKPENVILTAGLRPVITDFGIAAPPPEKDARLTKPGDVVGTPAYISPEQVMGERELDGRSDVFALGMMMFEALTGRLPQNYGQSTAQMVRRVNEDMPPVRGVNPAMPEPVARVVDRALARDLNRRWSSARQLAAALRDATVPLLSLNIPAAGAVRAQRELGWRLDLPRQGTQPLAQRVDVRFSDLQALLDAAETADTGFAAMVLHYPDCSDLMLFAEGRAQTARRTNDVGMTPVSLAELFDKNHAAERGVIDSFAVSERYHRALFTSLVGRPTVAGLQAAYVKLEALLAQLKRGDEGGVLKIEHQGKIALLVVESGGPLQVLADNWLDRQSGVDADGDAVAAVVRAVTQKPRARLDFFPFSQKNDETQSGIAFENPLTDGELHLLCDFAADFVGATGFALEKQFGLGTRPVLEKHLRYAKEAHPALLADLSLQTDHTLDWDQMIARVGKLARTGRRGLVLGAMVSLLAGRLEGIDETLSQNPKKHAKVMSELNSVWERQRPLLEARQLAGPFAELMLRTSQ